MKFGNDFWWRGTLTWICCQMWCRSIQDNQKSKGFVSNFCWSMHGPRRQDLQILPLVNRSRVIYQISASSNYRMGTFLPHAGRDHKPFQECPSKLSSSGTVQWTYGSVFRWRSLRFRSSHNFLVMLRRASTSGFLPNIETSFDRSREFPDTSRSSVAGDLARLKVLFFFVTV